MYERSAIVLERYFVNLFGLNKPSNLEQNYRNYCELYEKFNSYQDANNDEFKALEEFQAAEAAIEEIQAQEEKLYKKNAKYEYNRDLIFNDITQKPEEIEKCMTKIENDIAKAQTSLVTLRENFVNAVKDYNDKKATLSKCKKARKNAEAEYNAIFDVTRQNIENIPEEFVTLAKAFSEDFDQEELVATMLENGKEEKIPFNNAVVRNAVKVGFDIETRLIDAYLDAYNKTNKLIAELLEGAVSVELHGKTIRNIRVKLNFLNAEKDYLVQFLDYERIMVIHGKRTHRNLMLEACENFNVDVEQINNLYSLLVKEITGKSTKKAYKELYNKSYLVGIEENDEKFKKEKTKINLATATIMNTNYWRLEGIKNIYTVFYKDVVEVFGKDLDEFEVPKEPEEVEEVAYEAIEEMPAEEENVEVIAEPEVVEEPEEVFVLEQVSEDIPTLPGMEEAVIENEKGAKKASAKKKKEEEAAENIQVIEQASELFEDVFGNIEVAPAPAKKKAKKVKRYTRKKVRPETMAFAEAPKQEVAPELEEMEVPETVEAFEEIEEPEMVEEFAEPEYVEEFAEVEDLDEMQENFEEIEEVEEFDEIEDFETVEEEEIPVAKPQLIEEVAEDDLEDRPIGQDVEFEPAFKDVFDVIEEEPDIFGEKYKDIETKIAELDDLTDLDDIEEVDDQEVMEETTEELENVAMMEETEEAVDLELGPETVDLIEELDDEMPYEDEDMPYEEETDENSIFNNIENDEYEELNLKKSTKKAKTKTKAKKEKEKVKAVKAEKTKKEPKNKKNGILKNIMKLNAKDNKKVAEN